MPTRKFLKFQLRFPLLIPILLLSAGQYAQAIEANFWLYSTFAILVLSIFAGLIRLLPLFFLLAGSLSFLNNGAFSDKVEIKNEGPYFVRVSEAPRFRKVGEISLVFEILEPKDTSFVEYKASGEKVLCRGKDLPWENESKLEAGDIVFIKGKFHPVELKYNPFSFQQKLLRKGISYECKLTFVSKAVRPNDYLRDFREYVLRRVKAVLGDGEKAGLFLSMALGEQDTLSTYTEDAFKESGMAHLLVVSGYQISIVYFSAALIFLFILKNTGKLYLYLPIAKAASVLGFLFAFSYAAFVGFESSVVRALLGSLIFISCSFFERKKNFTNSLLVSLLFLQLIYPLSVFEPGVELTFAALIGMSLGGNAGGIKSYILSSVYASFATSIVSFFWFGSFSILGLILNPMFASLISIISCNLGFLSLLLLLSGIDSSGIFIGSVADCLVFFRDLVKALCDTKLFHIF
jgi:ComEC/Rec2-related protein